MTCARPATVKPFDAQQLATIDELIEGVVSSRETQDSAALALYAKQLGEFVPAVLELQRSREAQTTKYIVMQNFGMRKIEVIKALRTCVPVGLKEAKTIVELAPVVLARVNAPYTNELVRALTQAGAVMESVCSARGYTIADEVYDFFEAQGTAKL